MQKLRTEYTGKNKVCGYNFGGRWVFWRGVKRVSHAIRMLKVFPRKRNRCRQCVFRDIRLTVVTVKNQSCCSVGLISDVSMNLMFCVGEASFTNSGTTGLETLDTEPGSGDQRGKILAAMSGLLKLFRGKRGVQWIAQN